MDWNSVIRELQDFGLTQPQIAALCGCGQATLSDLANGRSKELRHALGESLRTLLERCKAGDVPKRADPANDTGRETAHG